MVDEFDILLADKWNFNEIDICKNISSKNCMISIYIFQKIYFK